MDSFLLPALVLVIVLFVWMSWRYISLRRTMEDYAQNLRRAADALPLPPNLPADIPGIAPLSSAVATLITRYEQQRESLRSDNARLSTILDQMTDGVLIIDRDGRVQFANPAALRLFAGSNPGLGQTAAAVLRHHQLVEAWQKCQRTRETQAESVEITARRQFVQLIAIPDTYAGGTLLIVQDLTRMRRLETVRRDFISNVSHELRTPLASLKALAETLQEGALDDPPAARRFLGRMQTEVDALSHMAGELLELTRIESGQVPLALESVMPQSLLYVASERMKLQAERAGLTLHVHLRDENLPAVCADAPRMAQVLVNLIHNAVKFTPAGGIITLSAAREGEMVCFAVRDTGAGIPADDLPRIFERFYRVDRSRTGGGTGLGLSISRHLVEAHGGRIWAESREGEGSTFYFTLPIHK